MNKIIQMRYYFFSFLCCIIPYMGNTCDCISPGKIDDSQYNEYQLIFKGKIIKIAKDFYGKSLLIKVECNFKDVRVSDTVKISTPSTEGLCGISAKVGEHWLIFAYQEKNYFTTDQCTRSKTLETKAWNYRKDQMEDDLRFLETKIKVEKEHSKAKMISPTKFAYFNSMLLLRVFHRLRQFKVH